MRQMNQFKVGDIVITKFPVTIEKNEDSNNILIKMKQYVSACGVPGCIGHGSEMRYLDLDSEIMAKDIHKLILVPRVIDGKVGYHLKLTVSNVRKTRIGSIQLVEFDELLYPKTDDLDEDRRYLYNHGTFIKYKDVNM